MSLPERPLGEVLKPASATVSVEAEREYPIAGIYSFGRGLIRRPTIRGSETSYVTLSRLRACQLTMSKLNAWEGALVVVPDEFEGSYVSPEYPVFDIDSDRADPAYVAHLARWPGLWDRLTPRGSMVRRKRTTPITLLATKAPLPDLAEQRHIAARLDSAMSMINTIGEKSAYASTTRKAFHESVFANEHHRTPVRIGDMLTLERIPVEPQPSKYYVRIGIRSFGNGIFHRDKCLGSELGRLRYFAVLPDRLIVSNIMAWEGAIAISTADDASCIASNRFLSYIRCGAVDIQYLNYYFHSKQGTAAIRGTSTGTVVRNQTLSIKDFEDLVIPLPSIDRQRQVASWLDASTRLTSLIEGRGEGTSKLRLSLLNAAFAGEL